MDVATTTDFAQPELVIKANRAMYAVECYRCLIAFFDILSTGMVLLTLAVQNKSSFVINPTNLKVPWPRGVYAPWFAFNLLGFGCGVVGAIRGCFWSVGLASILTVADLVFYMVHGKGKQVFALFAMPSIVVHFSFLLVSWIRRGRPIKGVQLVDAQDWVGSERDRKIFERALSMYRGVIVFFNLSMILVSFLALTKQDSSMHGLPLPRSWFIVWLIVSVLGRVTGIAGVTMNKFWLVLVAMVESYVDMLFYLFRGNDLGSNGESETILILLYTNLLILSRFKVSDNATTALRRLAEAEATNLFETTIVKGGQSEHENTP